MLCLGKLVALLFRAKYKIYEERVDQAARRSTLDSSVMRSNPAQDAAIDRMLLDPI